MSNGPNRVKIELKVTDLESGKEIVLNETVDFFHMEKTYGVRYNPLSNNTIKEPDGRTKCEIVFGNGIYHKDEIL